MRLVHLILALTGISAALMVAALGMAMWGVSTAQLLDHRTTPWFGALAGIAVLTWITSALCAWAVCTRQQGAPASGSQSELPSSWSASSHQPIPAPLSKGRRRSQRRAGITRSSVIRSNGHCLHRAGSAAEPLRRQPARTLQ